MDLKTAKTFSAGSNGARFLLSHCLYNLVSFVLKYRLMTNINTQQVHHCHELDAFIHSVKALKIDLVPKVSFLLRNSFWPLCLYLNWVRFKMYFMHLQVQTLQKNTVVPVCLVIILSGWVSEWHLDFHADRFVSRLVSADICPCGNERQQFSFGFFNIIRKCLLITERAN